MNFARYIELLKLRIGVLLAITAMAGYFAVAETVQWGPLIVMVVALMLYEDGDVQSALAAVDAALAASSRRGGGSVEEAPTRTTGRALAESGADLALVSVPVQHAMVEAMEGFSCALAARRINPDARFAEIRVVSNTTGDRAGQRWDLDRALARMAKLLGPALDALSD